MRANGKEGSQACPPDLLLSPTVQLPGQLGNPGEGAGGARRLVWPLTPPCAACGPHRLVSSPVHPLVCIFPTSTRAAPPIPPNEATALLLLFLPQWCTRDTAAGIVLQCRPWQGPAEEPLAFFPLFHFS